MEQATNTLSPTKSLVFWRQNILNGRSVVPVILTLEQDNQLTMKTAKNDIVFNTPVSDVKARFTGWGTMILTVGGKKYVFMGVGAALSPAPTADQKAELGGNYDPLQLTGGRIGVAGVGIGLAAKAAGQQGVGVATAAAGAVVSQVAFYKGLKKISDWQDIFQAAGVLEGAKNAMKSMKRFITILVIFLAIVFLAVYFGTKS